MKETIKEKAERLEVALRGHAVWNMDGWPQRVTNGPMTRSAIILDELSDPSRENDPPRWIALRAAIDEVEARDAAGSTAAPDKPRYPTDRCCVCGAYDAVPISGCRHERLCTWGSGCFGIAAVTSVPSERDYPGTLNDLNTSVAMLRDAYAAHLAATHDGTVERDEWGIPRVVPQTEPAAAPREFSIGDHVRALVGGKWFAGTITDEETTVSGRVRMSRVEFDSEVNGCKGRWYYPGELNRGAPPPPQHIAPVPTPEPSGPIPTPEPERCPWCGDVSTQYHSGRFCNRCNALQPRDERWSRDMPGEACLRPGEFPPSRLPPTPPPPPQPVGDARHVCTMTRLREERRRRHVAQRRPVAPREARMLGTGHMGSFMDPRSLCGDVGDDEGDPWEAGIRRGREVTQ